MHAHTPKDRQTHTHMHSVMDGQKDNGAVGLCENLLKRLYTIMDNIVFLAGGRAVGGIMEQGHYIKQYWNSFFFVFCFKLMYCNWKKSLTVLYLPQCNILQSFQWQWSLMNIPETLFFLTSLCDGVFLHTMFCGHISEAENQKMYKITRFSQLKTKNDN